MRAREWTDTYAIHYWRFLRSSYRKLASLGFEPTTTVFHSHALTDWAIRPSAQLALRANFLQLLQFHLFVQCSRFISAIAFVNNYICFRCNRSQVITCVQQNELVHMGFNTKSIWEIAIESWPEWDWNPQPVNSVQTP